MTNQKHRNGEDAAYARKTHGTEIHGKRTRTPHQTPSQDIKKRQQESGTHRRKAMEGPVADRV